MDEEVRLNLKNAGIYSLDFLQKSSANWTEFLRSSSNHYSRNFIEQLLITSNYPNATAVMEKELWKKNHYKVNYGEEGIAVFKDFDGEFANDKLIQAASIKVYYDISQVHRIAGSTITRWNMGDVDEAVILNVIGKNYSEVDKKTFPVAVLTALGSTVKAQNNDFKNFIVNSAAYQILTRCGYNAESFFKISDFNLIRNFKSNKEFIEAATAISQQSGKMLKLIARAVRQEYNKITASVNKEEKTNGNYIQSERRLEQGRTTDNIRQVYHGRGRSKDTGGRSQRRGTDGIGQVRSNAPKMAQGRTGSSLHRTNVTGEYDGVPAQHRGASTESQGYNNRTAEKGTWSNRETERTRPDEMGGLDEQHNSVGGRDSAERDNLRLNQKLNKSEVRAEVEENQTSAFSISQEDIDATLQMGGNVENGKFRIYEQFLKDLPAKENIKFLKDEYGWGGSYPATKVNGVEIDEGHDSKGITISKGSITNPDAEILLKWKDVEKRIRQLISLGRYLNEKEKEQYPAWIAERKQNKIKRSETPAPAEKENIDYIYQYNVGDKVYLGADNYEITYVDDNIVKLHDINFPLLDKEMERSEFDNRVKESLFNEHLKVEKIKFDSREFIEAATDKLQDDITVRNAHKNSDLQNYNIEVKSAVDNYITQLMTEQEVVNGFAQNEIFEFINKFQSKQTIKDYIYSQVSENVDISLTQLENTQEKAEKLGLPFSDKFSEGADDELDPFVYDGSMSLENFEKMQELLALDCDRFYIDRERESVEWIYYNPDSTSEGQYVVTEFSFSEFIEAYENTQNAQELFEYITINIAKSQSLIDKGTELFDEYTQQMNDETPDFVNITEETKSALFNAIHQQPVTINKSVDELKVGDIIRFENEEWTINNIDSDFSVELRNNDKSSIRPIQAFWGHWKENLTKQGFEYIASVSERNIERTHNTDKKSTVEKNLQLLNDKINYTINDDNIGVGTKLDRFKNNIKAIRLLKKLETENRFATYEEQEILSKYVGWGGLSECFDERHSHYRELKSYLSDEEFNAARESSLTAFYTPPVAIRSIYRVLDNLGFKTGNILEPSCGVGNFMGMLPESMQDSKMFGVELDSISGRIAKQLYQKNNISIGGYESENLPDSFFDVAVGNVPFGKFSVSDKRYNKHKFLIHDYFFAKTLDKVRPGGVIAFITSKGTMDKKNNRVRKYIAERATLLGAIRLPNDTFKGAAGTDVTSDVIFLQKKEALSLDNPDWLYLKENKDGIIVNQYFADNPDMIIGDMKLVSGPHDQETACVPNENATLEERLSTAVENIKGQITTKSITIDINEAIEDSNITTIPDDPAVKNYSYTFVDGELYFRKNSIMEKQNISGLPAERIKGLIKIREILGDLIEYQTEDYPETDIIAKRKELNEVYEQFKSQYGLISSKSNRLVFREDSSFPLLTSLEIIDEDGNLKRKSDIFFKRTIRPYVPVTHAETAVEALAVSMNERGKVDIEFISELTGFEQDKVISDLKGVIFAVPGKDEYQPADEYLSGNVREKLFIAQNAASTENKYLENVEALKQVQPKDLSAAEVNIRLGATWIDPKYIREFIKETFKPNAYDFSSIEVSYSQYTSKWNITGKGKDTGVLAANTYGTKEYNAYYLLEQALNLKIVKVYDTTTDVEGKTVKVFNPTKTTLARQKQEKIHQKFEEWIFSDPQRRKDLLRTYNDTFNNIRNRQYDGSYLSFPGMNPEITLRPHQVNAIARTLYGGNTLLAHVVGAGKTFEMVASAMEAKRIGLCNKLLFVVPNHLTEQMGADFLRLYPAANILVATKNDFTAAKRKEFCSRIATGDYDAVIIGHSQFEKIPVSTERQEQFMKNEIADIIQAISEAKAQDGESFTVKQLEGERKKLEKKLKDLYETNSKDDVVTFEQLGVDRLFVDEAHKFKNLFIRTKMTRVAGISSSSANKSADLLMKCRYIDEITGGRGIVFATGTPVSNSVSELYTMQRYLQSDTLKKLGFSNFDAWASTFGATVTASELAPEGKKYREKTRFSKFYNLPELMSIFKECADIQTADMLNLPVPKANFTTVVAKPSKEQRTFVDECGKRADLVRHGDIDPTKDNMLKITTDGRKLAVDQRIIDPSLPDFPDSKVNKCVDNVFNIWHDTLEQRSTQLIFCDLSTPSDGFNVYDDIREKLINRGVPNEEIAFIHDYNTDAQKAALFSAVRQGKVRILLGSTEKMGAGTNVQDKLIALHDLDCPWRPSDLEQRLGRIVRQGNENSEVNIFRYVTEDTFDAYSYQIIENKQKFISQIMSSKTPVREAEDVDQSALSYAEIKMLATGNPLIKEKMDLDIKLTNLKVLKADYLSNKYNLEDIVLSAPTNIANKKKIIDSFSTDITTAETNSFQGNDFKITLNGVTYTDKKNGGLHLIKILENLPHQVETDNYPVGEYRGFSISVGKHHNLTYAYLQGEMNYSVELSSDVYGNITRLNNKINSISERKEEAMNALENFKKEIEQIKVESKKPFEQEQELKSVTARLEEVTRMLDGTAQDVEFRQISDAELNILQNSDIEFEFVSNSDDFIARYNKADSDRVQAVLDNALENIMKK